MSEQDVRDASDDFASSTTALLTKIEEADGKEDNIEKLKLLGPSFEVWSNYWVKLEDVWFGWLKTKISEKFVDEDDEKIPITKKELQIVRNKCDFPREVISKSNGLMTRVFSWVNEEPIDGQPEDEEYSVLESVWMTNPNNKILVPMKHWNDFKAKGGNWRDPGELQEVALKVVEEYGYTRVKNLSTTILWIVSPKSTSEEITNRLDLETRSRKQVEAERKRLAKKLDKAGFEYFQDPSVFRSHVKKLASRRVVCFSGKGAMGKSAIAVEITKKLLDTEGDGKDRKDMEDGLNLKFPMFGTNYILKTTKSSDQGDYAIHDEIGGVQAGDKIEPKIRQIADYMRVHQAFDEVLRSILKKGGWSGDKIRSAVTDEKRKAALEIIKSTPIFILLDNYEDIENNIHEKEKFDSFLKEYYETPETEAKNSYILITSREGVDPSIAQDSKIQYLSDVPSRQLLVHLLTELPKQTYTFSAWMIQYQAILVSSFEKLESKLKKRDGPGQGGFPPLIALIAHTFLSSREKPEKTDWVDEIVDEVIDLHGDKLNKYVFGKSSKQIRQDFPHSWRVLEEFSERRDEFTEEDFRVALESLVAEDIEVEDQRIIRFLLECESRDLVEKTLHPQTGEHLYTASISVSLSPGKIKKLEYIGRKSAHTERMSELERELQNLEDGHGREDFVGLLGKAKKITLERDFNVEEYDCLARIILSLEGINRDKKWGRDKDTDALKTKHRNRGIRRVQSLDDLSFLRSGQFINDMIELAGDGKKINFSTILRGIAELVSETESALLLEDELVAAGLLDVLNASIETEDSLDRLALKKEGSEAWLIILAKVISNPGIERDEIERFVDFSISVIGVNK